MRARTPLLPLILACHLVFLAACGGGVGTAPESASRADATYWELKQGLGRVMPAGAPPLVGATAGTYWNPADPKLAFEYPAGWTPYDVPLGAGAGVALHRDDGSALWRRVHVPKPIGADARQLRDAEIDFLRWTLGVDEPARIVTTYDRTEAPAPGRTETRSNALAMMGDNMAQISVRVTYTAGTQRALATIEVATGPVAEYAALAARLFIPLHFRLEGADAP